MSVNTNHFQLLILSESNTSANSLLNFAVTDGRTVVATRYASKEGAEPATLYFSSGSKFGCDDKMQYQMIQSDKRNQVAIITSEPLTDSKDSWVVSHKFSLYKK